MMDGAPAVSAIILWRVTRCKNLHPPFRHCIVGFFSQAKPGYLLAHITANNQVFTTPKPALGLKFRFKWLLARFCQANPRYLPHYLLASSQVLPGEKVLRKSVGKDKGRGGGNLGNRLLSVLSFLILSRRGPV